MADSSRSGRALGTAITSAIAANVAGAWLFLTVLDVLPRLSQAWGVPLPLAFPAIVGSVASALAYEAIIRAAGRLRRARPADSVHVRRFTQAQLMLAASSGAGLMLGLILQSTQPTESWGLLLSAMLGVFWGFAAGILSATLVFLLARAPSRRKQRPSGPPS
jgi:hypothetical protein